MHKFKISKTVQNALRLGKPVVALESTIITHGMPFPDNLKTALQVEEIVRDNGAIPATIALMDGYVKVGLEQQDMERLAKTGLNALKTSRRDMALALSQNVVGATTVSGTMVAAHKAGIKVFVTGGIGGVHRGAESTFDISADLTELGKTPVAVVCAGVKSILDIEKTLEYLETQGVTTVTLGESNEFPSFYTRKSGCKAMTNIDSIQGCADLIRANVDLGLNSGIVIAVPIPKEHEYPDPKGLEETIQSALEESKRLGIKGKDSTPFLLGKVKELTQGHSLKASSQIATAMYPTKVRKRPVIVGGTVVDVTAKANVGKDDVMSTSSPGTISKSLGGVGRNVAEACHRAGGDPLFITAIGDDLDGHSILEKLKEFKMDVQGIELVPNETTAVYNAMLHQDGELIAAVADMRMHSLMKSKHFENVIDQVEPSIICTDGNIEYEYLEYISKYCIENNVPLLFEPTSVFKSMKVYQLNPELLKAVKYITPDAFEAKKMRDFYYSLGLKSQLQNHEIHYINGLESESESMLTLLNVFDHVILKCGWRGVLVGSSDGIQGIPVGNKRWSITHLEPNNADDVVSVTGAGDTLVGVLVAGISKREAVTHKELVQIVKKGMNAAELTIQSSLAVSPLITSDILE